MLTLNKLTGTKTKIFSAIVLALILIVAFCEVIGWPFLRQPLAQFLQNKLERTVKIDSPFKLKLIGGLKLQAAGFSISAPPEFEVPSLATAKDLELKLRYSDLWGIKPGDPYVIKSIKAEQLDAHLSRYLNGKSTWQFNKKEQDAIRPFPVINTLVIRKGQAHVDDRLTKADLVIDFNTNEGQGNATPTSKVALKGEFRERKLKAELTTQGFLPIASQDKNTPPASSKGWLDYGKVHADFEGSVDDLFGEQNIKGKLSTHGPSLGELGDLLSITLPHTKSFKINGKIERSQYVWLIDVASARVGQSDLNGKFEYDTRPERSLLKGQLAGKRFYLVDLAPAFGSDDKNSSKRGRIFPDQPLDFATYNRMNAEISVNIDYVDLGKAFKAPIAPLKASLNLNKNKLSLAKIDARTAQGNISGEIFIDAHEQKELANPQQEKNLERIKADWGIYLAVKNINLEKWITISDARKKEATKKNQSENSLAYVTGLLNGEAKLKGKGNSTAQLLRSLNGDLSFYIRKGEISHLVVEAAGLDIAQALGLLIKGDQHIKMQCAVMNFKANNGIMKSNVALVDTPVTTIVLNGNINMGEEKLDLKMTAEPKNFSPLTVRSPLEITGTFLNPNISPDIAPIGARAVGAVLLGIINPLAAIIPFLDPGKVKDTHQDVLCNETLTRLKKH
ncbi:MAG: AsmA family protein [Methylotenera sp.]|uniref:AsmA family protein n=1 Tax=Methylotenera sp. TaxID=2051956 RepID=UPI00248A323C|nr:AsmA family protein [Methylotenera sp.]MDI1310499.1 AsmA family protein [Methylotenera sp.]